MTKIAKKRVAVIGGGVSGLAATKAFKERGHEVVSFERTADIGGVWELSRSYPDVQTQSPKDLYRYTDLAMPDDYPEWPKGPQVHAYLHSYADKHGLKKHYRMNTNIKMMDRVKGKNGWQLEIEKGGKTSKEHFDFVAICTGQFSDKNKPEFGGEKAFSKTGTIMHSSEYTNPAIVKGKRVVVLGGSKSATDVAVNAAKSGAKSVTLVYRKNVWRVPYKVGGINFKRLLYMRAQESQFNSWGRGPIAKTVAAVTKPLVWANFRGLETMLKMQLGLKKWDMVPDIPIEKEASCSLPIVTPGLYESFKSGEVVPIKAGFERYEAGKVVLTNGDEIGADLVVLATGWHLGVPYLAKKYLDKIIDKDGLYKVYRFSVNPDVPDMGFVGFNSSFCTVLSAEMIANWLVRYADGQLANMPTEAQMRDNIEMMNAWKRDERPAAQVYQGLCSAPFHFKHFDELLADMGAIKRKRANPIAEQFSYPNAEAYGSFLQSCPQYQAS